MTIQKLYDIGEVQEAKDIFLNIIKSGEYTVSHYRNRLTTQLLLDAKQFVSNDEKLNILVVLDNASQLAFSAHEHLTTFILPNDQEDYNLTGVIGRMFGVTLVNLRENILDENFFAVINLNTNKTHIVYLL